MPVASFRQPSVLSCEATCLPHLLGAGTNRLNTLTQRFVKTALANMISGMVNVGAWPVDPATEVGLFRTELGDLVGVPHAPADNLADFEFLSDEAIAALILAYPTSRNMAMSRAMTSMATQMIAAAQDIVVDDIRIKTVERANLMLTLATTLYHGSMFADASTGFGVVGLAAATDYTRNPQGTPAQELYSRGSRAYGSSGF